MGCGVSTSLNLDATSSSEIDGAPPLKPPMITADTYMSREDARKRRHEAIREKQQRSTVNAQAISAKFLSEQGRFSTRIRRSQQSQNTSKSGTPVLSPRYDSSKEDGLTQDSQKSPMSSEEHQSLELVEDDRGDASPLGCDAGNDGNDRAVQDSSRSGEDKAADSNLRLGSGEFLPPSDQHQSLVGDGTGNAATMNCDAGNDGNDRAAQDSSRSGEDSAADSNLRLSSGEFPPSSDQHRSSVGDGTGNAAPMDSNTDEDGNGGTTQDSSGITEDEEAVSKLGPGDSKTGAELVGQKGDLNSNERDSSNGVIMQSDEWRKADVSPGSSFRGRIPIQGGQSCGRGDSSENGDVPTGTENTRAPPSKDGINYQGSHMEASNRSQHFINSSVEGEDINIRENGIDPTDIDGNDQRMDELSEVGNREGGKVEFILEHLENGQASGANGGSQTRAA